MRIGIDARFVGPQGTGLGKYTEKLITSLAKIDSVNKYAIFLQYRNWDYLKLPKNFTKVVADVEWYSLAEQYKMPAIFASQNLDLLHIPHFNVPIFYNPPKLSLFGLHERSEFKDNFVITIHDLIHHEFSQYATTKNPIIFKLKRFAYKKVISHAVTKSAKILTPSNFVKEEIIETFKINPSKVVVTYEAAEEEYFTRQPEYPDTRQPNLIYVGNAYPHKNLERLLDAIKILNENPNSLPSHKPINLIIVCPRDVFQERLNLQIKERNLTKFVEVKGYLPVKSLVALFAKATAYVFPSLSEGFGIPGLNAMASGLPVVTSNIPVLKEVYGDAALYFDPKDPKDIAEKIHQVLTEEKTKSDLVEKGKVQVKKYSWLKMAKQTLQVYEST